MPPVDTDDIYIKGQNVGIEIRAADYRVSSSLVQLVNYF